jgi:hypothetical protein
MSDVCQFIAAEKAVHPVALLRRVLGVVRSSSHVWRKGEEARQAETWADDALVHEITAIHPASEGACVSRGCTLNCATGPSRQPQAGGADHARTRDHRRHTLKSSPADPAWPAGRAGTRPAWSGTSHGGHPERYRS